jgi:hypothetical protein
MQQHRRHYVYMHERDAYRTYCGRPSVPAPSPAPWHVDPRPLCRSCRRAMNALSRQQRLDQVVPS